MKLPRGDRYSWNKKAPTKLRLRRSQIVHMLSDLAKDGWRHAKPCDYVPLEKELEELNEALRGK